MAESPNPYAAPSAPVADPVAAASDGTFVPDGRAVPAGNGWSWIASGWKLFVRNPGIWILITLILWGVFLLLSLIPAVGGLVSALLTPPLVAGYLAGAAALTRGEPLEISHAFAGFREKAGDLVMVGLLYLVGILAIVLGVGALFGLGLGLGALTGDLPSAAWSSLLLAVLVMLALFVPLAMALWFAPALVLFHGLKPIEALSSSFKGCLKNVVPFLLYGLIAMVLGIIAMIPLLLGLLAWIPVISLSVYTAYRDIFLEPARAT